MAKLSVKHFLTGAELGRGDLEALIDRDIRSLYKTGIFEFIEVKREQLPGNQINIVIEVTPKFRVLTVKYEGNKAIKARRLSKEIKTVANGPLDERQIKEDSSKLYEFYQKRGFNQAQVTYTIDRNRTTGFSTVTFKVREGSKVKVSAVNFVGNDHVKAKAPVLLAHRQRPAQGRRVRR